LLGMAAADARAMLATRQRFNFDGPFHPFGLAKCDGTPLY
jgi:hypothetical protein